MSGGVAAVPMERRTVNAASLRLPVVMRSLLSASSSNCGTAKAPMAVNCRMALQCT